MGIISGIVMLVIMRLLVLLQVLMELLRLDLIWILICRVRVQVSLARMLMIFQDMLYLMQEM